MTLAASCADTDAAATVALLDRLCDVAGDIVYFPVRHHSPVCAQLVSELIQRLRPAAVLIEGPSDFNERFAELHLDHELPIAIFSYFRSQDSHSGAYYPFCEYSPEWAALRTAKEIGATAHFIDLPWATVAPYDRSIHRYADAELRRSRYVETLCERMQVEDFDDLWDKLIESHPAIETSLYLRRVHSLCLHVRLWQESVSRADLEREAFMAEQIRTLRSERTGKLLVVTGGFHSSALAARLEGLEHHGLNGERHQAESETPEGETPSAAKLELEDVGIALTTYSYERLDSLTGYNAGMPNPGFYEHAWRQRQAGEGFSHQPLLANLVEELRERKQTLSTADLIAVETAARGLAALRGRSHVWRRDLIDAVTSALLKDEVEYGCESPFLSAVHAVLRGNRRGRLATGTRMPPLVLDIQKQLAAAKVEPTHTLRDIELNLLDSSEILTSRLLHRLKLLGIVGFERTGGTNFLERGDLTRLWEAWRIRWRPEFEATCIEASRYGVSLADAASARLAETAREQDRSAPEAAALLVQAAQAGVEALSDMLIDRLSELILGEAQFVGAAIAMRHLLYLYRYDEAFGTSRLPQIARLLGEAFGRSLWLLELVGQGAASDADLTRGMQALLETHQRTSGEADEPLIDHEEFIQVISRVESDARKPAVIRGAAAGILWTLGAANDDQILSDLMMFAAPADLGDFLAGLFAVAREVAQRHTRLVQTIDRLLMEFGSGDFQTSLPSLRLAFTYFTPREKHHMLTTLFQSLGLKTLQPLARLQVNEAVAAEALALEERLFEQIAKYGLEER